VDFLEGKQGWRLRDVRRKDLLSRAVGMQSGRPPRTVLDATAGLGFDAASLAMLGLEVTALEQSPVVYALIEDGFKRALLAGGEVGVKLQEHLHLRCADSRHFLRMLAGEKASIVDVVYLDPMFPERRSAKSRKELQHLQALLPPPDHAATTELFKLALAVASRRVVVKRPLQAPEIAENPAPSHCLKGKSVRFDVYIVT
jgi:16S rRNA (guanine1516-N2)-methyltransferase